MSLDRTRSRVETMGVIGIRRDCQHNWCAGDTNVTRKGESPTAMTASARRCGEVLNQQGEVPDVERAEMTGRRVAAEHGVGGRLGIERSEGG